MFNLANAMLSLAEGFGLAFSPCILPILPFILASSTTQDKTRPFLIIGGFIATFTVFSLVSRQLLAFFDVPQDKVQMGAYALLLVFGIIMIVPWFEEKFAAATGGIAGKANDLSNTSFASTKLGGLMIGALIGLVWTPCAGPILASALLQVIQSATTLDAAITIFAFSIGAGIPMLAIALFGQYLTGYVRFLSKHSVFLRRVMGVIMVAFALLALSGVSIAEWAVAQTSDMRTTEQNVAGLQHGLDAPYKAPQIAGIKQWFNTKPLALDDLKGKVVLVDFWTYSCINCIRTLPYIKDWYAKYKDNGLVVIGVHAPEFDFEGKPENVQKAIAKFGITYPVAMDNDFATWKNYQNRYWPAHYLIDKNGMVVYTHFGEGNYDITENNIRYLLGLQKDGNADAGQDMSADNQTPETYLGTARAVNEDDMGGSSIPLHYWKTTGDWKRESQYLESTRAGEELTLHFAAKKVFLVMENADGNETRAQILLNGKTAPDTDDVKDGMLAVSASQLYTLADQPAFANGTVTIRATAPGLRLFAFTFEG